MYTNSNLAKKMNYQTSIAASVLLQCKTVVEKEDFVSTGILTYAEGDVIEVEIAEYKLFDLGKPVKLTVYSKAGIYVFHTMVVAKDRGAIMVLNPPDNRKKFKEQRETTRVQVDCKGILLRDHASKDNPDNEPIALSLKNISLSGMGLAVYAYEPIPVGSQMSVRVDIGFPLTCRVEIIRCEFIGQGHYYGVRMLSLTSEQTSAIRAFIVKTQTVTYFSKKKDDASKAAEE
ncbi:hypothetical protein SY83_00925 [Paenibacillus swuensis]|uniref:PilZ domain-containing protein n=1 Tax=Paenibacillus swuensis TaxID=1178515 RepID=A0A172TDM2_9BACL|nr:PilZ domain-containing protein [Paenibacillus swuensis]ANE45139.1 hypothetical protein SY83_00925 [Paenibacillus swuensis]